MDTPTAPASVRRNDDRNRYELAAEGFSAVCEFNRLGSAATFTRTGVPEALRGQGVSSTLVRGALDDVRARGLEVVPLCPFVAASIRRHDDHLDLVSPVSRRQLEQDS